MKNNSKDLIEEVLELEEESKAFGFYWENLHQILEQIISECKEVEEAYSHQNYSHCEEEIGDLIHAAISLAFFCGFNPQKSLEVSFEKYKNRFNRVKELVEQDGLQNLTNQPMEVLMRYWKKAKKDLEKV